MIRGRTNPAAPRFSTRDRLQCRSSLAKGLGMTLALRFGIGMLCGALVLAGAASAQQSPLVLPPGTNDYRGGGDVDPALQPERRVQPPRRGADRDGLRSRRPDPGWCRRDEADNPAYTIDQLLITTASCAAHPRSLPRRSPTTSRTPRSACPRTRSRARILAGRARGRGGDPRRRLQRPATRTTATTRSSPRARSPPKTACS